MARPTKASLPTPRAVEINTSRLGLIAAVRSTTVKERKFTVDFAGRTVKVSVQAMSGVPAGVDFDVLLAIQTLYKLAGCPLNRTVVTNPNELLQTAQLGNNGPNYKRLRASLERLLDMTARITDGWYDAERKAMRGNVESFRYLDKIVYGNVEIKAQIPDLDVNGQIALVLSGDLASSIRSGFVRQPDSRVLKQLREPTYRHFYCFLDANRYSSDGLEQRQLQFSTKLLIDMLGLEGRMDSIRRSIQGFGEALHAAGVLKGFSTDGEGREAIWSFEFARLDSPEVIEAIALLSGAGVGMSVAEKFAHEHTLEAIVRAVQTARFRFKRAVNTKKPVTNLGGLIIDILRSPDKYAALLEQFAVSSRSPLVLDETQPLPGSKIHRAELGDVVPEKTVSEESESKLTVSGTVIYLMSHGIKVTPQQLESAIARGLPLKLIYRSMHAEKLSGEQAQSHFESLLQPYSQS